MNKNKAYSFIRSIFYFALPVILLFIIFHNIELSRLKTHLDNLNISYLSVGLVLMPLTIILGSYRWFLMSNFYTYKKLSVRFFLFHYWAGLAIGYFTPGNIGWDGYRAMSVSKKLNFYVSPVITIFSEKFIALLSIGLMILIIYPVVSSEVVRQEDVLERMYLFGMACFICLFLFLFLLLSTGGMVLLKRIIDFVSNIIKRILQKWKFRDFRRRFSEDQFSFPSLLKTIRSPRILLLCLILSWGILITSALANYYFFKAVGFEVNLFINLLAAPVFFILFFVPLSFGSLGVREGVYIFFYGLFGVPAEIALLVSLLHLTGLLLNSGIGAVVIFTGGLIRPKINK